MRTKLDIYVFITGLISKYKYTLSQWYGNDNIRDKVNMTIIAILYSISMLKIINITWEPFKIALKLQRVKIIQKIFEKNWEILLYTFVDK